MVTALTFIAPVVARTFIALAIIAPAFAILPVAVAVAVGITAGARCTSETVDRIDLVAIFGSVAIVLRVLRLAVLVAVLVTGALLFLAQPGVGQDTEIMVRELQVIFGHHPVAGHLRIARHVFVFFQQLGGIATCAAVDAVALITSAAIALRTLVVTAATAAALTIVHRLR